MKIKRIVPNISSNQMEESKRFYRDFLGLNLVMDMEWILTFASRSKATAQLSVVKSDNVKNSNDNVTITIEVEDVDKAFEKAEQHEYNIIYPLTDERWGVRRFFVKDPNGVTINLMSHINQME